LTYIFRGVNCELSAGFLHAASFKLIFVRHTLIKKERGFTYDNLGKGCLLVWQVISCYAGKVPLQIDVLTAKVN
jgi:hypothetical protein